MYKLFSNSEVNILSNEAYFYAKYIYEELKVIASNKPSFFINDINRKTHLHFKAHKVRINHQNGYYLKEGILVEPLSTIKALLSGKEVLIEDINQIVKQDDYFVLNNKIKAKKIILANGHNQILKDEYIQTRQIFGSRIEISTSKQQNHFIHGKVSISPNINNKIIIGSTNHKFKPNENEDKKELLNLSKKYIDLDDTEIKIKSNVRACSFDYFPYLGKAIDTESMIKTYPKINHGQKIAIKNFKYKENIYIINALASKGFSMSPYLANELISHIYDNKKISDNLSLERRFLRWVRKH